jgi:hypothetical protein
MEDISAIIADSDSENVTVQVIIKQSMCNSGMKWTDAGAGSVLFLRTLNETDGRWTQFWGKTNRNGINIKYKLHPNTICL